MTKFSNKFDFNCKYFNLFNFFILISLISLTESDKYSKLYKLLIPSTFCIRFSFAVKYIKNSNLFSLLFPLLQLKFKKLILLLSKSNSIKPLLFSKTNCSILLLDKFNFCNDFILYIIFFTSSLRKLLLLKFKVFNLVKFVKKFNCSSPI